MLGIGLGLTGQAARRRASGGGGGGADLFSILDGLGHSANLLTCLDAGALASYGGSGQTWADLSPAGADFVRGSTNGADATDPTFNGAAGALTDAEYWSGAGSFFTEAAGGWGDDLFHTAGAAWTILAVFYVPVGMGATPLVLFANQNRNASTGANHGKGISFYIDDGRAVIYFGGASPSAGNVHAEGGDFEEGRWHVAAVSYEDGVGYDLMLARYIVGGLAVMDAPTTGDADSAAHIGAVGGGGNALPTDAGVAAEAIWSVKKSGAELGAIFDAIAGAGRWSIFEAGPVFNVDNVDHTADVLTLTVSGAFDAGDTFDIEVDETPFGSPHTVSGGEAAADTADVVVDPFTAGQTVTLTWKRSGDTLNTIGPYDPLE